MKHTIQEIPFFSSLSAEHHAKLKQISYFKEYNSGEILFYEGDEPTKLHILVDGVLRLYKTDPKGHEIYLHQFIPTSMVGELANFENIRFPATARFVTSGTVLKIDYTKLEEGFFKNPEICSEIIKSLTKKVRILSEVLHKEMILTSEEKVAKFIDEHAELFQSIKNNQIADILNVSPETLSRTLSRLKKRRIISVDREHGVTVLDREALKQLF